MRYWLLALFLVIDVGCMRVIADDDLTIYGELTPGLAHQNADGAQSGLLIDVMRMLQRRTGHAGQLQMVPWVRGYRSTLQNQAPVALFAAAFNEERRALFYWVGPLVDVQWCFSVLDDSGLTGLSLEQARELPAIGVVKNDAREALLRRLGFTNLLLVESDDENVRMLQRGRTSAWLSSTITDRLHLSKVGLGKESIRHLHCFERQGLFLVFNRVTPEPVYAQWRDALAAARADGEFEQILAAYGQQLPSTKIDKKR
ncbi:family 3 extracellular solute-binding protein [Simiduia agarivorans SA1 = DSM 21679]|uniref:Family 3 extracellular solute-binding protein n=2 Tax=Simiduia TaxID=447467 RepID=K4KHQ0_SIMAS|nr:family 3 extracellular solute-binding protein [Simiduia agarivorans SA1 = DSM 21679]